MSISSRKIPISMTTAYATHNRYTEHNLAQHPEHAGRIEAVWEQLKLNELVDRLLNLTPSPVTKQQMLSVHTQEHIDRLQWVSEQGKLVLIDRDTYALPSSFDIARLSAGGVISTIDAVMTGKADNGMAIVRPPGHHATPGHQMGFCLLSNIAIGARHAQTCHDVERVLIIDYDVHHGNGTQDAFYTDDSVMFISVHQSPFYPGTGLIGETGKLKGHRYTLNVPITEGHGDDGYRAIFEEIIWVATEKFDPELILVSAGFDAHFVDPLAGMKLSLSGYDHLARECIKMADTFCDGKIIFVMEGGYDLKALSHGWRNIAYALLDEDELSDPYGEAPSSLTLDDIRPEIDQIRLLHEL